MPSVKIAQPVLLSIVKRVAPFAATWSTMPVLTAVKLSIGGDFSITADNLDMRATCATREVEIDGEGAICLYANRFLAIVRALDPAASIVISWGEKAGAAVISCFGTRYEMQALPALDFPEERVEVASHSFTLPAAQALDMFKRPAFAISTEETRYYLNGLCVYERDGKLRACATDGHRLAVLDIELPEGAAGLPPKIVPAPVLRRLAKLSAAPGINGVTVFVGGRFMSFDVGGLLVTARLIDGTYPDVERVIPKTSVRDIVIDRRFYQAAIRRVSALMYPSFRGIIAKLDFSPGKVRLEARDPDYGTASDELPCRIASGDEGVAPIGLNLRYFKEALQAVTGEEVTLSLIDSNSPVLMRAAPDFFVVQMPARFLCRPDAGEGVT